MAVLTSFCLDHHNNSLRDLLFSHLQEGTIIDNSVYSQIKFIDNKSKCIFPWYNFTMHLILTFPWGVAVVVKLVQTFNIVISQVQFTGKYSKSKIHSSAKFSDLHSSW